MKKIIFIIFIILYINSACNQNEAYRVIRFQSKNSKLLYFKQEIRYGFNTSIPANFNWKLTLPADSILEFSLAANNNNMKNLPRKLTLIIKEQKSNKTIYKKNIKSRILAKKFKEFQIDLNPFGREIVNLNFELKSPKKEFIPINDLIYWEQPKVIPRLNESKKKNVLIITIDTLRSDHLSYNDYLKKTSPNIDAFALQAINFTNAFSVSSATWPSLTSMMTSVYPSQHGVIFNGYKLIKNFISLPEILQKNNYQTAAILGNMRRATHNGYDYIFKAFNDEIVMQNTLRKLNHYKNRKFFMWVHFLGPHAPYSAPENYYKKHNISSEDIKLGLIRKHYEIFENNRKSIDKEILQKIIKLYDIDIEYTDSLVGNILEKVKELKLTNNTIIIISADHGEELCQHHNYLYHSGSLYDSSLKIPLLIYSPNIRGKKVSQVVSNIDIAPTILDLLNLPKPVSFEGESLLKTLNGRFLKREFAFSETHAKVFSIRNNNSRFISNPTNKPLEVMNLFTLNYSEELYNSAEDQLELQNIIAENKEAYIKFSSYLKHWIRNKLPAEIPSQIIDEQTIEQLKALGYIR